LKEIIINRNNETKLIQLENEYLELLENQHVKEQKSEKSSEN
jgi:hypothetical protein